MKFADLHLHTAYSDGTYTPEELIQEAVKSGISAISVVDHDTVDGIEPVMKVALGRAIEVIPGVELTAEYGKSEVHILGYFIDFADKEFGQALERFRNSRQGRAQGMIAKLGKLGIDIDWARVQAIAEGG